MIGFGNQRKSPRPLERRRGNGARRQPAHRGDRGPGPSGSRQADSADLLYGRNPVIEAMRAGRRLHRIWLAETGRGVTFSEVRSLADANRVRWESVEPRALDALVGPDRNHQGVVAEADPYRYADLPDILASAEMRSESPLVLVLDALQDPQNLGTLLRTALATGVHGVVIPEHRAVAITPAVSRTSAGAVEHLAVTRVTNLARSIRALKERGVWVYGLDSTAAQPFWQADWRGPAALVVGAEGSGLGRLVREACDVLVSIPMASSAVQSLNAATAGSLALYEAYRSRLHGASDAIQPGGG